MAVLCLLTQNPAQARTIELYRVSNGALATADISEQNDRVTFQTNYQRFTADGRLTYLTFFDKHHLASVRTYLSSIGTVVTPKITLVDHFLALVGDQLIYSTDEQQIVAITIPGLNEQLQVAQNLQVVEAYSPQEQGFDLLLFDSRSALVIGKSQVWQLSVSDLSLADATDGLKVDSAVHLLGQQIAAQPLAHSRVAGQVTPSAPIEARLVEDCETQLLRVSR
jgi:hypothetical protein